MISSSPDSSPGSAAKEEASNQDEIPGVLYKVLRRQLYHHSNFHHYTAIRTPLPALTVKQFTYFANSLSYLSVVDITVEAANSSAVFQINQFHNHAQ